MMSIEILNQINKHIRKAEKAINEIVDLNIRLKIEEVHSLNLANRLTPEEIIKIVANTLNIAPSLVAGLYRKREIVEARMIAIKLCKKNYPEMTLKQIASYFSNRNHASILYSLERHKEYTQEIFYQPYINDYTNCSTALEHAQCENHEAREKIIKENI